MQSNIEENEPRQTREHGSEQHRHVYANVRPSNKKGPTPDRRKSLCGNEYTQMDSNH